MSRQWIFILILAALPHILPAQNKDEIYFAEAFSDPSLPGWEVSAGSGEIKAADGTGGQKAVSFFLKESGSSKAKHALPAEKLKGKSVIIECWIKAESVMEGAQQWNNAKIGVSWKSASKSITEYARTWHSDFNGNFNWRKHQYLLEFPDDLENAGIYIGLENCSGTAFYCGLTVYSDRTIKNQKQLDTLIQNEKARHIQDLLDQGKLQLKKTPAGIELIIDEDQVPPELWNASIRSKMMNKITAPALPGGSDYVSALSRAYLEYAESLALKLPSLSEDKANLCVFECASRRVQAAQMADIARGAETLNLLPAGNAVPVNRLLFGNNINWGEFDKIYTGTADIFTKEFFNLFHPLGVTFLRYPGGCNADSFSWQEAIGPMEKRPVQVYDNQTYKASCVFGVDEYLRFCEKEKIEPLITLAFLWDDPRVIGEQHPRLKEQPWIKDYLQKAPERVELAAAWVEYCNGSVNTPMGKLRAQNGHPEPYHVRYWEVGNETFGPDKVGSCTAEQYAAKFAEFAHAMKKKDPQVLAGLNGHSGDWDDTVLKIAGKHADFLQTHIYLAPKYSKALNNFDAITYNADKIAPELAELEKKMKQYIGKIIPLIISEYGYMNLGNDAKVFLTSMASTVLVADMLRAFIENPLVSGAQRWCLYENYYFTCIGGPSRGNDRPYYYRPDQRMFSIYNLCRSDQRIPLSGKDNDIRALAFVKKGSYGLLVINRSTKNWKKFSFKIKGLKSGEARSMVLAAAHPLLGSDRDAVLADWQDFSFSYNGGELLVPPCSVNGFLLPAE